MTDERQTDQTVLDRFRGCMLASAAGGALGRPVDAKKWSAIQGYFGESGITQYAPDVGGALGLITGDTQLALFTADGLLRSWVRLNLKGITSEIGVVMNAYQRWLLTQGEERREGVWVGPPAGVLNGVAELAARRITGETTFRALQHPSEAEDLRAQNTSMGAGALSRGLPAGLYGSRLGSALEATFGVGRRLAALTHGHECAVEATGALAALVDLLTKGEDKYVAVQIVQNMLARRNAPARLQQALAAAVDARVGGDEPAADVVERLGTGRLADECLAIGVYCLLSTDSLAEGLVVAVNHGGDSDTTGTIAGGLLGAAYGADAILPCWVEPLELHELIGDIATDLYECPQWFREGSNEERIWERYPGY